MITATCFGLLILAAVLLLAVQDSYWRGRVERATRKSNERADKWEGHCRDWQRTWNATSAELHEERRTSADLRADLARERREKNLLHAGILDAQREVDYMAKVLPFGGRG